MKHRLIPFGILAFISLLSAYISGNDIYYIIFWVFVFITVIALVSLIINYTQLNYLQKVTPNVGIKGETVVLDMQIHNDFFMPLALVEIEYDLPDDSLNMYSNKAFMEIGARDKSSVSQNIYCKYRGKWPVGIRYVKVYDIFGLFHITLDFYNSPNYRTQTLEIKPRIVHLDTLPLPFKESSGAQNQLQKVTNDTAEVSDIRKYAQGDILKKIHWKLSAAKQEILVKNHALSLDPDTLLYVDCSFHGLEGISAIELEDMIVECAAAVANYLINTGMPTKIVTIGGSREELSAVSTDDFTAVYESIARLTFKETFSFFEMFSQELAAISNVNSIFIITHTLTPQGFDSLIYLRQAAINITVLLVEPSHKVYEKNTKTMISELIAVGVKIIYLSPGDDINARIKEQTGEKQNI